MTISPLPFGCSAVSDSARLCRASGPSGPDLRSLAIQSLEANANFHGQLASFAIHIESNDGTIVLNGRVPSFYLTQVLQETLLHVVGVTNIQNHAVVVTPNGLISID